MRRLSISLLGPFRVTLNGNTVTDFGYDKVRALLAYLTVEAGQPIRRESLATLFWPDQPANVARHSLSQALLKLRQAIRDPHASPPFCLTDRDTVQFNLAGNDWLDVDAFTALLEACDTHLHEDVEGCQTCIQRLQEAVDLYRGEFLEGLLVDDSADFEDWVVIHRERLHRQVLMALHHLTRHHARRRECARAQEYALRQVALEPYREEAHRELMCILARSGQRSAALAQYEACRRILAVELGVEPSAETQALYERIRAAGETRPHNLPLPLPSLIGRDGELEQIAEHLADPDCRLLTLAGPGGIGKTSLALHAAQEHLGSFLHGTYFIPLAPLRHADQLLTTITSTLSLTLHGESNPQTRLLDYLRDKSMLLALDSFEHLMEAAGLLADILQAAPHVRLLVTSRERLNLQAEWVLRLEGLSYPANAAGVAAEALSGYSAIQLFLRRARRVAARFVPTDDDYVQMARICGVLQGSPLGIELAAGWADTFACRTIADEIVADTSATPVLSSAEGLSTSLDFLATSLRDVPERHHSLRAAFEHSWRLLAEEEQAVLCRLSVFRHPFRRTAAREVAGATPYQLAALVNKSLVNVGPHERYDLHPLLRQYLAEKLASNPQQQAETEARHGAYFADFMAVMNSKVNSGLEQAVWPEVKAAMDDVVAALHWAVTRRKPAATRHIITDLYNFYAATGQYRTGQAVFGQAVSVMEDYVNPSAKERRILAKLLAYCGVFSLWLAAYGEARERVNQSLDMARQLEDQTQIAVCFHASGTIAFELGDYATAKGLLEEALAITRQMRDDDRTMYILYSLGSMALEAGTLGEAHDRFAEGLAMARAMNHVTTLSIAIPLDYLGVVAHRMGEPVAARERIQESLAISRAIGHKWNAANCLRDLGRIAADLGEYEQAEQLLQESLAIYAEIGKRTDAALALRNQGWLAECLTDCEKARRHYQESSLQLETAQNKLRLLFVQADLGRVMALLGRPEAAELHLRGVLTAFREFDHKGGLTIALTGLGILERERGNLGEAQRHFREALRAAVDGQEVYETLKTLVELAELLAEQGDHETALEILAFAQHHQATPQYHKDRAEALATRLATNLPPNVMTTARERGKRQTLVELVTDIL